MKLYLGASMDFMEREKIFYLSKNSSIWLGIITVVVLIANKVFSSESHTNTTLLIIALVVISLIFQGYLITTAVKKDFFDRIKDLEAFIENNGLDKIVSEKSLSLMESMADEIWVFTRDLKNDIGFNDDIRTKEIFKSVKNNIKQGKKYTYFIPDNENIRAYVKEFKHKHKTVIENQITFVFVEPNHYHFISEIAVYNPNNSTTYNAVQWFPDNHVNYYMGFDKEHLNRIVGIGTWLLDNSDIVKIERV